uniref:Uncharacterized protein n=1 Tax=Oryza rufipogon TaxID=4529 RepID=A0A0E0R9U6_ORYRU
MLSLLLLSPLPLSLQPSLPPILQRRVTEDCAAKVATSSGAGGSAWARAGRPDPPPPGLGEDGSAATRPRGGRIRHRRTTGRAALTSTPSTMLPAPSSPTMTPS